MRDTHAFHRYLQRHAENSLPCHTFTAPQWHQVIVLPAYRETSALLENLRKLPANEGQTLVILVLNRPDSDLDPHANSSLRTALEQSQLPHSIRESVPVLCLNKHTDLYLLDMEAERGPTPQSLGVGLARKTGCDLALQWIAHGGISGHWICSTDADATLPLDYFEQLKAADSDAVAAVYPFRHSAGRDEACNNATALYELRLHHYVLGLEFAGSPYAYHTLGSALAVRSNAYAHVHGFPKRAGAEDFYLLNKLAKLGAIARLHGSCIELQSRESTRVPFGTGPAVAEIMTAEHPHEATLFYHPQCFVALQVLLHVLPALAEAPDQHITSLLVENGLDTNVAQQSQAALDVLGIVAALAHCQRQSKSSTQFQRQFHQWFDGFRTLKFVHALRDACLPAVTLAQLNEIRPRLWPEERFADRSPSNRLRDSEQLREAVRQYWGWQ